MLTKADKALLSKMLREINRQAGTDFHYLAELDILGVSGVGQIVAKYIEDFSSESVKG